MASPTLPGAQGTSGSGPTRNADIIMKGGLTSGIVYPLAVVELSKAYRFRNIGGTSAGAIAAAATAAAELGRLRGQADSFAAIADLPDWLGRSSRLFSLFQPQQATARLFAVCAAALGPPTCRAWRLVGQALYRFWPFAALGALPGLILAAAATQVHGLTRLWILLPAVLLLALGTALAVVVRLILCALQALPANGYGLCSGMGDDAHSPTPALTPWLADYLDRLAGCAPEDPPLTFGDLWGAAAVTAAINLEMVTTCLTQGRPYTLPFDLDDAPLYFDPDDFARLFPARIVTWLKERSPGPAVAKRNTDDVEVWRLPPARDLPVIVATRLSLSFPLLMSAVRLYAVDSSRAGPAGISPAPEPCWFSDGGLTSNMPVHFFDRPLPRWPTFAINLRGLQPGTALDADECNNVHLPLSNDDGSLIWWSRFQGPLGFLGALPTTMQNWADNEQLRLPGYRDRVAHIALASSEGGLNLKMSPEVCKRLSKRGRCAGIALRERFTNPTPAPGALSWDNHRWIRYRSTMSALQQMLAALLDGYSDPMPGERTYAALIERPAGDPPTDFAFTGDGQRTFALRATHQIVQTASDVNAGPQSFVDGAPNPGPQLRITPRVPDATRKPARPPSG